MSTLRGVLNPWQPEQLEKIHQASLNILEQTGIWVGHETVLDHLAGTAARVDRKTSIVKFPAAMVQNLMQHAPGSWDRIGAPARDFSVSADSGPITSGIMRRASRGRPWPAILSMCRDWCRRWRTSTRRGRWSIRWKFRRRWVT